MYPDVLRVKLLDIFQEHDVLNTCQVCRVFHGRDKNDIVFCRGDTGMKIEFINGKMRSYFNNFGGYKNCVVHKPHYKDVRRNLVALNRKGLVKTFKGRFNDPQKIGNRSDVLRLWGHDLSPILKTRLDFYL